MQARTPQQSDIISAVKSHTGHLLVDARAGTGKTTTIVEAVNEADSSLRIVACAFNKDIATELSTRLPENAKARTLNSLGHAGLFKLSIKPNAPDTKKPFRIQEELKMLEEFPDLRRALGVARAWGIVPESAPASPDRLMPDTPETYQRLFDEYDIDTGFCQDPMNVLRSALLLCIKQSWKGHIDFDDQVYHSAIYRADYPKADLVMVDEAQDISPINRAQLRLMLKPSSRLMAVGDRYQAIYGFRGADRRSIPNIEQEFGPLVLPLTTSFRCPVKVIEEARRFVPDIDPWDQAKEGIVDHLTGDPRELFKNSIRTAVLCRYNAPIIRLAFSLIRKHIPATILGRDIATSMIKMLRDTKQRDSANASRTLWQQHQSKIASLKKSGRRAAAQLLEDKCYALAFLCDEVKGATEEVCQYIERLYRDKPEHGVTLATVHKSKGLEWPTVYILDPELMPSEYAVGEEELAQEKNLQYVAVTRSQERLFYINSY